MSEEQVKQEKKIYQQIMKGTAVFGGSQMINMLANVIKGKFTAIFLGASGMGVSSLLGSALSPFQQFFTFSLPVAGVRDIASQQDEDSKARSVLIFRRVLYALAFLGMITMALSSTLLSQSTFGNNEYSLWFVGMSVALLFFILTAAENTILQGYRHLKAYATTSVVGSVCGLLFTIPLYWLYGVDGIVPSMMILSFVTFVFSRYFTSRIGIKSVSLSWRETLSGSRTMLMMGGAMMLAGLLGALSTYFTNTFIRSYGNMSDIGLYNAATIVTIQCTTLVFSSMSADYYPHLSELLEYKDRMQKYVQKEGEMVLLVMAPIISLLILFSGVIVRVLLTSEFDSIVPLLRLIALSFMGRAFCFPLDYVCLAKGDKSFFFWVDGVWTNIKTFLLCVCGYYFFGLIGLGYAMLANAFIDIIVSAVLNKKRYQVSYNSHYLKMFMYLLLVNVLVLGASYIHTPFLSYSLMLLLVVAMCIVSLIQIFTRIRGKHIQTYKTKP